MEIQKHKSTKKVAIQAEIGCLGAFTYGYVCAELTIAYDQLAISFGMDKYKTDNDYPEETSDEYTSKFQAMHTITTVSMHVGALLISYFGQFILKKMGRRQYMLFSDVVLILGCCLGLISNLYSFLVARFIMGIALGMNTTIVSLYVKEISPVSISGVTGSLFQINCNLGIILANCISLGLHQVVSNSTKTQVVLWRLIILVPAIFACLRMLLLLFVFKKDTPFYYFSKGSIDEGIEAIKQIYKDEFSQEIQESLLPKSEISNENPNQDELKTTSYKNRFIVGMCLQLFQQMTGINAVIQFASGVFGSITTNYNLINYLVLSSNIALMLSAFFGTSLSTKFGRKFLLQVGYLGCLILLIAFGIIAFFDVKEYTYLQAISIIIIFLFYFFFNCSPGPITWILNSEIVKEKGMSYCVLVNWIGNISCTLINLNSLQQINFLIFGGFTTFGFLFMTKYVKETKDKTYPEIQKIYDYSTNDEKQRLLSE